MIVGWRRIRWQRGFDKRKRNYDNKDRKENDDEDGNEVDHEENDDKNGNEEDHEENDDKNENKHNSDKNGNEEDHEENYDITINKTNKYTTGNKNEQLNPFIINNNLVRLRNILTSKYLTSTTDKFDPKI